MPWLRAELKNEGTNKLYINHTFRYTLLCSGVHVILHFTMIINILKV